jgi:hypothetical protein
MPFIFAAVNHKICEDGSNVFPDFVSCPTNIKQITMTEIQVLEIWDLYEFIFEKQDL